MMFWYGHDVAGWGYAAMVIGMILFWGFVVLGIVALARYVVSEQRGPGPTAPPPSPAQILAARFAAGEITESEYRERLAVLHHAGH